MVLFVVIVHVGSAGIQLELLLSRNAIELVALGRCRDLHGADSLGFLDRLLRPDTGDDVVGGAAGRQQIHGHHRELQARATLEEQNVVTLGHARERAQVGLATLDDLVEGRGAMADLEHRHADAGQRQQVLLDLLEHGDRQHGRTGGKVVNASGSRGGCHFEASTGEFTLSFYNATT